MVEDLVWEVTTVPCIDGTGR